MNWLHSLLVELTLPLMHKLLIFMLMQLLLLLVLMFIELARLLFFMFAELLLLLLFVWVFLVHVWCALMMLKLHTAPPLILALHGIIHLK